MALTDQEALDAIMNRARKLTLSAQPYETRPVTVQSLSAMLGEVDRAKRAAVQLQQENIRLNNQVDHFKQAEEAEKVRNLQLAQQITRLENDLKAARLTQPHAFVQRNARPTSIKAAQAVLGRTGSQRVRILQQIVSRGQDGAIDDEVAQVLDMMPPRVASRRAELASGGWIETNGKERKTRMGQDAAVWVVTQKGLDALRALDQQQQQKGN